MAYERIPYLYWAKSTVNFASETLDFTSSGMPSPAQTLADLPCDLKQIPFSGNNFYGYAPLNESIAARYNVSPGQVTSTQGSSMANYLFFSILPESGTILVENPVYQCLPYSATSTGHRIEVFARMENDDWQIPVDDLRQQLRKTSPVAVILTNPHNPTGCFVDDMIILRLAEEFPQTLFLVDEVYREWIPGENGKTIGASRPNIIATSSLTKVWGLGSLRLGWMIADSTIIERAKLAFDHMGAVSPLPLDWLGSELFKREGWLDGVRTKNIEILAEGYRELQSHSELFHRLGVINLPEVTGGVAFIRHERFDGIEMAVRLLRYGILVAHGEFFGRRDYFRISWTQGAGQIRKIAGKIEENLPEILQE